MTSPALASGPAAVERPIHVLLAESDPALRGLLSTLLAEAGLRVHATVTDERSALEQDLADIDVVLIDLDPLSSSMGPIRIGTQLKRRRPEIGIVVLTEERIADPIPHLPEVAREGWCFLDKAGRFDPVRLCRAVTASAWGLNVHDPGIIAHGPVHESPLEALTERQRQIISLAAVGMDATSIADQLSITPVAVRQELSKVYAVLIPNPRPGTDLRTVAVLRYLRLAGGSAGPTETAPALVPRGD